MKITMRVSKRGVPHLVCKYQDREFSVCYIGKGKFYRIFEWNPCGETKRLLDVEMEKGKEFDLQTVLDNLIV